MKEDVQDRSRGDRNVRDGVVVSRSGDKSIVVQDERRKRHPLYGKVIRLFKKYHVHDAQNQARPGDRVQIVECRPFSKMKRWRLLSVQTSGQTEAGES